MDFFQRLGNWFGGKGWVNDEEKRRKEQQQAAARQQPQSQPAMQRQHPRMGGMSAVGPSQALQDRQHVQRMAAQQRSDLIARANAELNTAIDDKNGYYKQDADKLREELGKGSAANHGHVQGLLQSVQNRRKEIAEGRAPTQPPQPAMQPKKKPGFFDYLNPLGEHGLFGAEQQKTVRDVIEKPITNAAKSYENWVDTSDDEKGFQWTNPADYLRFAAKLPSGMVTGAIEAPRKAGEAISGVRVKDDDSIEHLSALQRAGAGADAAISLGGLPYGGSGTLIKSAFGQGVKEVAKQGGRQAFIQGAKSLAKDAAKEGVEEVAQAFAQDLSDDGKVNTPIDQYVQSGLQGALGGGMMHAGGKATQAGRRAFNNYRQGQLSSPEAVDATIPQASPALKQAVSKDVAAIEQGNTGLLNYRRKTSGRLENFLVQEATEYHIAQNMDTRYKLAEMERNAARQMQFDRHNASLPLRNAEFNQGAVERLAKGLEHGTAEDIAFIRMRPELLEEVNAIRASYGMRPLKTNEVTAFKGAVNGHLHNRVSEGMTPNAVAYTAADALINPESKALPGTKSRDGYDRSHIQMAVSPEGRKYNTATIAGFNDQVSLKNVVPRSEAELKNALQQRKGILSTQGGETGAVPPSTMVTNDPAGGVSFSARQSGYGTNIAKTGENVNTRYKLSPEQAAEIRAYNDHISLLRQQESKLLEQGLSENSAPIINNRKAQAEAIYARDHIGEMSPEGVRYRRQSSIGGDIDENGKHYKLTPEQEAFFKDSKVRDENGNLLKMHHGTNAIFDTFDKAKSKNGWLGKGFYLTPDKKLAKSFGRNVKEVYANVKNPFIVKGSDPSSVYTEVVSRFPEADDFNIPEVLASHGYDGIKFNHWEHGEIVSAFEPNQVKYIDNLNPADSPDMRYHQRATARLQKELTKLDDLKSRHLELTGDEKLVFNEWRNAMEKNALGYYDPKTDKININQLTADTLNHELGHKLLRRAENNAELIAHIRQTVGDDALVARYGKDYGTDDLNLLAEEYLADGFSDYSKGILNGEDKVRLATRLNIPQEIIAVYDRIIEAVKSLIGKQDQIRQFYAQAETGEFRSAPQATTALRRLEDSLAYRLDSQQAKDTVARFNSVKNGWRRKTVMSRITPEAAEMYRKETGMPVGDNARLILSESAVRHMKNQGHIGGKGKYGVEDANPITDADIADIPVVFANPDSIQVKNEVGYKGRKIELTKQLDNRHVLAVELEQKPDGDFYIISYYNKSRSPRQAQASGSQGLDADFNEVPTSSRPKRPGEASDDSIANPPRIVNDKRFKVDDDSLTQADNHHVVNNLAMRDFPELIVNDPHRNPNTGELILDIDFESSWQGYRDSGGTLHKDDYISKLSNAYQSAMTHWRMENSAAVQPTGNKLDNAARQEASEQAAGVNAEGGSQAEESASRNLPLPEGAIKTKGNLYEQTKLSIRDDWSKPWTDGPYEYRQHTKRDKQGNSFTQFERRYIGEDGTRGAWMPDTRAAYTWRTQSGKIDNANRQALIQEALRLAKEDGEVREYVASRDLRSDGVSVHELTGDYSVDGGLVRNAKTGEVMGNYIQVTPFGVINQVAGKMDVIDVDTLASAKHGKGGIFNTFNRIVDKNITDEAGKAQLKDFYYSKTDAYANFADASSMLMKEHDDVVKSVNEAAPLFRGRRRFWEDVGRYIEGEFPVHTQGATQKEAFARKYGVDAARAAEKYAVFFREKMDRLIDDANTVRRMYGYDEIEYRKDYMPHIQKQRGILGRIKERALSAMPTGIRGDMEGYSRGEIPAKLAGLSGEFKPNKKFNVHEKKRYGGMEYELDPRKAFEAYADLVLYNTHMEPVIAKGRSIEAAMRAADDAKLIRDPEGNIAQGDRVQSATTVAVMDLVNEIAGKSNALDRGLIDRQNNAVQMIRKLESINGANKILGNLSSTLAQTLNLRETTRETGLRNTGKAIIGAFTDDARKMRAKSAFLRERYTDTGAKYSVSTGRKVSNAISKLSGMELVEKAFIEINWNAHYYKFKKQGLKGFQLIKATDMATERAVGGRGIGAMPQAYRSAIGKMFLQFTYEVNESFKNDLAHMGGIFKDAKRGDFKSAAGNTMTMAEAFATATALNWLYGEITGNEPLPDLPKAIYETIASNMDDDETNNKGLKDFITTGVSQVAKMHPGVAATVNTIPQRYREDIFGKDSDFGRFDGATGVAQTAANFIGAGHYALDGKWDKAGKSVLGVVPMGSQIKKTLGGYNAMSDGTVRTESGKVINTVDKNDPVKWAQALAFGKNALKETQDGYKRTTGFLSEDQTKTYDEIRQKFGEDSAKAYLDDVHRARTVKGELKKAGVTSKSSGVSKSTELALAEASIKIRSGDWREENGLVIDKKGNVQKAYHKALAQSQGQSDEAYQNWMKAYDIDNAGSKPRRKTGNSMIDGLEEQKGKTNSARTAARLMKDAEKYRDLPEWVKDRYYEKSGYKKHEIEYAALSSYAPNEKLHGYWLPRAQAISRDQLIQELTNGRRESILGKGSMLAPNGVIDNLALRGVISKDEARALRRTKFAGDGTPALTGGGGNGGRGGRRGISGRARSSAALSGLVMSTYQQSLQMSKDVASRAVTRRAAPDVGKLRLGQSTPRRGSLSGRTTGRTPIRVRRGRKY